MIGQWKYLQCLNCPVPGHSDVPQPIDIKEPWHYRRIKLSCAPEQNGGEAQSRARASQN